MKGMKGLGGEVIRDLVAAPVEKGSRPPDLQGKATEARDISTGEKKSKPTLLRHLLGRPPSREERDQRYATWKMATITKELSHYSGVRREPESWKSTLTSEQSGKEKEQQGDDFTWVRKDGRNIHLKLKNVEDQVELQRALRAQGLNNVADEVAGRAFKITPGYKIGKFLGDHLVGQKIGRRIGQVSDLLLNIGKVVEIPFRSKTQASAEDDKQHKKTKTYTVVAEDGKRYYIRLPRNHTLRDVKQALHKAGAGKLAEEIVYSKKPESSIQKLAKAARYIFPSRQRAL